MLDVLQIGQRSLDFKSPTRFQTKQVATDLLEENTVLTFAADSASNQTGCYTPTRTHFRSTLMVSAG